MDAISQSRLSEVCPELARRVSQLAGLLETEGITIRVTQGLRSWDQQAELYAKGRDADGNVVNHSLIVTNAPPGHSFHNFGLAVDVVPDDPSLAGFQADWNTLHPAWKRIIAIAPSSGLLDGASFRSFPDWPHLQLQELPLSPTDEDRQVFLDGGMVAVWEKYKQGEDSAT